MPSLSELGGSSGRLTVEERGRLWGEKAQEKMRQRRYPVVLIVRRTEEYDRLRKLPRLVDGDVRFELGRIRYTTWREKITEIDREGKRRLKRPKRPKRGSLPEYEVLLPRGRRHTPGYLDNLPQLSPVQELLFHHADTIEEAITKVGEIVQTPIRQQAQEVIAQTARLSTRFIERGLTEESLRELAGQTSQLLENIGLANPSSPSFRKEMERLKKACERDSRGRINNLVSRIRVQSAYVWAIKRLVVGSFVQRKHGENLSILVYERETTRWALGNATRQLESFLGHVAFRQPERETSPSQLEIMAKVLRNIAESLRIVRVAPYLVASREAAINLVGCREEKWEANRIILGERAEELFALTPVTQLLEEGKINEVFSRVKNSLTILEKVLKGGQK